MLLLVQLHSQTFKPLQKQVFMDQVWDKYSSSYLETHLQTIGTSTVNSPHQSAFSCVTQYAGVAELGAHA